MPSPPATGYRWGTNPFLPYSSLAITTRFDDVAPHDITTSQSNVVVNTFSGACAYWTATAYLIGECDFGQATTPATFNFTVKGLSGIPIDPVVCEVPLGFPDPPAEYTSAVLQYLDCVNDIWVGVTTPSGTPNGSDASYTDYSGTFPIGITARYFRVLATNFSCSVFASAGATAAHVLVSDFRITGTLIPILTPVGLAWAGVCEGSQATLTWNPVSNAGSYNLYKDGVLYAAGITATMKVVTGLTIGTTYNFTVSAVDICGFESVQSAPVSVTPCANGNGWSNDANPPPLNPADWTDDCLWSTQSGWTDDTGLPF